jgi:Ca2+-dependent lipid-binding protein
MCKILQGQLFRNTEIFGQMDPFVVIDYDGKKYKTKVLDDAGKNPIWNQTIEVPIKSIKDNLKFTCYDEDFIMDSCVGEAVFKVTELVGKKQWFTLEYNGKLAAKILMDIKFIPRILKQATIGVDRLDSF